MLPYAENTKQKEEEAYHVENVPEYRWYNCLLYNMATKVILAFMIFGILVPVLVYHFMFFPSLDLPPPDGYSTGSCLLPRDSRLSCGIGNMNDTECHLQCCFDDVTQTCFHRYPSRFSYIMDRPWTEDLPLEPRVAIVPFKNRNSLPQIKLLIEEISSTHLSLLFHNTRDTFHGNRLDEKEYTYSIQAPELNIHVNGTQGIIFNTIRGPLIASDNIWEISFKMTEERMYGLGEIPLQENTVKILYNHKGGLSGNPLIFAKSNESYHGVLIEVKEPTEVTVKGDNQIVVRSITQFGMKFHIFVGPEPSDIMRDVMKLTGSNNDFEYWMLGAHVCSDPVNQSNPIEEMKSFLQEASDENLPFESHCGAHSIVMNDHVCDDDDDELEFMVNLLEQYNKKFVPHISPYIQLTEYNQESDPYNRKTCTPIEDIDQFMLQEHTSKNSYKGKVNDKEVMYPDYENIKEEVFKQLLQLKVEIDGVILENDWPLDESEKSFNEMYDFLPYYSMDFEQAFNHTPRWDIVHTDQEKHLYYHNLYGNSFVKAFQKVYENKIYIKSSSQWMSSNFTINRQNVDASWTNFLQELVEAALGGISGHWLWSSPICGDTENFSTISQSELCIKWYMAATYFPMIKIHSKTTPRHPLSFTGTNKMLILSALNDRLSLLPYIYTTLQKGPLLRPMFYQFPKSEHLEDKKTQFSVGESLLIIPNIHESQLHVNIWKPPGNWYEFWSGIPLPGNEGDAVTMTTNLADFLTLIRGGSIVVMQKDVKPTAEETRLSSDYTFIVALQCDSTYRSDRSNITHCHANSSLYLTDHLSLNITTSDGEILTITASGDDFESMCDPNIAKWSHSVKEIIIYGFLDEFNNYDHHREIKTSIDLCDLENENYIEINLIN